ncbi:unnamed protein product [Onchocerca flexuosa]|uniref:CCDC66 domain-containing protein n=1 Tax=Onchocerca flexuosa TaxID=387005 RepID=A0A183I100_9BILA|nr:unnamed protein product [Onchocerca flexuosa]
MLGTRSINYINTNYDITSKQAYSCGRFPPTCGYAINPVAGSNIMHEKVPLRKIGTTTQYMSANVYSNLTKKGSYYTQIYKNGLSSVNDHTEQKVNNSDESGNRYRSNDFRVLHAESNSKRYAISELTTPNILQSGFMDITNRDYATKSVTAPFSMKPADVRQNSLPSFLNDEYGTMRAQASYVRQVENFNYELSTAGISRKISNEHSRSSHRDPQEETISGQEYMKRLLQAHHVVDELLRSRGLMPEDEIDYLRNWRQKMDREPKIEERNVINVSNLAIPKNTGNLDTSEASQQHCTSNASDSGLSMDADSDNDLRDSPKLRGLNSQKFMVTDLLPTQKHETPSVKSVKVNIVKTKKHKNVYLKVIIRKPQQCWLHMDAKITLEKKEAVNKKTTNSNATRNSKKSCSKKRQTVEGQTEQAESKNLTHIPAKSNKKSLVQCKRLNQDCKMKVKITPEPVTLTSIREPGTVKSNGSQTNKDHNVLIPKLKCETINVCFYFVNKLYQRDKTSTSLSIARFATVKKKSFAICSKKFLEKTEGEQKLKCNKNNSVHVLLLAKTRKLPFNQKYSSVFPELQNMEKTSKIKVVRKDEVLESKNSMTEIKKDLPGLKKIKKRFKFPISIEESAKKLKTPESASSFSVPHMKKITPNQARKTSTNRKQQLCTVTVSKKLCKRTKLSQLQTAMTVPVKSSKIKITQSVMIKKMMDNKEHQHKELVRVPILKKEESIELKKVQKVLQNYATVTPNLLRHVPANSPPAVSSRPKNVLSGGSDVAIAGNVHQQSPGNQFGVMLKRVDRAALQKNKRLSAQVVIEKDEKDMTEAEKAMMVARRRHIEEETAKLQEYEEKRRVEREREEEELRKLKEKKERRKLERKEEERQFQEKLKQEEERRKQEEDERKAKMEAEKRKKEDEKRKRQQMLLSQFTNTIPGQTGRNFIIPQKSDKTDKFGNIVQAKQEMGMTKEQQEEAKRNYLVSVKHTIEFENVAPAKLREKIRQLHQRICKLEADKYDLEKRHERQEYDLRELNERQRQVARNKALKKGLGPADANSRHPVTISYFPECDFTGQPKVSIVSKYDRQIDRRNFKERRAMFENVLFS